MTPERNRGMLGDLKSHSENQASDSIQLQHESRTREAEFSPKPGAGGRPGRQLSPASIALTDP
jgi:hypothetical protein